MGQLALHPFLLVTILSFRRTARLDPSHIILMTNMSLLVREPGSFDLVKYGGYCSDVVDQKRLGCRNELMKAVKIAKSQGLKNPNWNRLHEQLVTTYQTISQDGVPFPQYKAYLLSTVVCPYISEMSTRKILSPTRYQQLSRLIALMTDDTAAGAEPRHPVHLLLAVDEVWKEVRAEAGLWPSALAGRLSVASSSLWSPILTELRDDAQSLSFKFLAVGLVDAVGKPLLLAYPLWLICEQALKLVQAVEVPPTHKGGAATAGAVLSGVNASVVVQITKAVLLLFLVQKFISLLELFSGAGQACLVVGACLYGVTTSPDLLKKFAPALVQHLGLLASFLARLGQAEKSLYRSVGVDAGGDRLTPSDRVEEITPEPTAEPAAIAVPTATSPETQHQLRKRLPVARPVSSVLGVPEATVADSGAGDQSSLQPWTCSSCTFINSRTLSRFQCEMCQVPRTRRDQLVPEEPGR
jgi:hypothetical protein